MSNVPSSVDLNVSCRFCLSTGGKLFLLFALHRDPALLSANIRDLTTIEVGKSDGVNYKICEFCCTSFELCIKFRQNCIRANKLLQRGVLPANQLATTGTATAGGKEAADQRPTDIKEEFDSEPFDPLLLSDAMIGVPEFQSAMEQYGLNMEPLPESFAFLDPYQPPELMPTDPFWSPLADSVRVRQSPAPTVSSSVPSTTKLNRSKYLCKICNQHFFQKNVHQQQHQKYTRKCLHCLEEKLLGLPQQAADRHTCPECAEVASNCGDHLRHMITHHAQQEQRPKDSYRCERCDRIFVLKGEHSRGRIHDCRQKLQCPHCPQTFHYVKSYQKHLRHLHPADAAPGQAIRSTASGSPG